MEPISRAKVLPSTGYRVLIVEDDTVVGLDIRAMLDGAGYDSVGPLGTIDSALAALAAIQFGKIDAALLDLKLGGEKAYAVADALVAKGIPFIIMSGYSKDALPEQYRQHPALPKPFLKAQLIEALQQVFGEPYRARSVGAN